MVDTSQIAPTLIGIGLLVVFIIWYKKLSDSYPELTFGELINKLMIRQHVTFILGLLFAVGFSEALFAATIKIVGEAEVNVVARLIGHISMQLASVLTGARAAALLRIYMDIPKDKRKGNTMPIEITICAIIAVISPYLNYLIIAGGLGAADLGIYALNPKYAFWAFKEMPYALKASTGLFYFHILLLLADVANLLGNSAESGVIDINEVVNENNERAGGKAEDKTKSNIEFLLKRYKFKTVDELNAKITEAANRLKTMDAAAKQNLARKVSKLKDDILALDNMKKDNNWDHNKRQEENRKLREKIANLFAGSLTGGKGFGITLPSRGKK